jgi:signal transduction histidine kinase
MKKMPGFKSIHTKFTVIFVGIWWLMHTLTFGVMMRILSERTIAFTSARKIELFQEFIRVRRMTSLTFLFSALIGTLLILLAVRSIIRPIRAISQASRQVALGHFDIELQPAGRDEIGRLTADFNLMVQALRGIDVLRRDFVANVSHEFKTPITSIKGYAELIRDGNLSPGQVAEYAALIADESSRLSQLAANLLRLSELDSHLVHEQIAAYSLDEQIRKVVLLLEIIWQKKSIVFHIDLQPLAISASEHLLQEVWMNLIHNAIQFSPPGGCIRISLNRQNDRAHVEIADEGPGIREEDQPRVFERFFKADASRSGEGTGLGLVIAKKILEISHGDITFASQAGHGTTFKIDLPLHVETEMQNESYCSS